METFYVVFNWNMNHMLSAHVLGNFWKKMMQKYKDINTLHFYNSNTKSQFKQYGNIYLFTKRGIF